MARAGVGAGVSVGAEAGEVFGEAMSTSSCAGWVSFVVVCSAADSACACESLDEAAGNALAPRPLLGGMIDERPVSILWIFGFSLRHFVQISGALLSNLKHFYTLEGHDK